MFRKIGFIFVLQFVVLISCNNAGKGLGNDGVENGQHIDKTVLTEIEFESKEYDFGTITSGENVSHRFKIKNIGSSKLYIKNVSADCGCTVIDYDKEAILPGKESYIEAVFNSSGYRGTQVKKIKVYTNTKPEENELVIAATIDISEIQ
ncbi:MAG: hypothetical protein B6I20_01875 [Bacteroidetes bacterium 4572_117]|nr:MAG: hypothetical protein B6I20_01875 [Bacteroidetes bacterium 4572_117]